ncbi:putative transcriptional regulatory protein, AsnC/Lrp family; putative leucine-responsive regulatory protein [Bradyrhizobium sp. ORS 278]|uniref:Lrp/AsnC family transcriptional regulator n=1 Tax=Bradyrhizobium sp. (strain ORS 278) TaxID=114615 RepID=UPI000150801E|nr:Lrp/AsnC family transcriptional regulator [Bradyrhizobium sp. ORS 278]CAL77451.1 putative transcriptional regulatory protein, AsnC/Lrp family; putative leucine-responsive regulatory protein [Bradyrhizobium sp. ORS 278]
MAERPDVDVIDRRILAELQADGRIRINELADRVGISQPNCLRRVRALRGSGVIKAIRATIDERALGYEVVSFVTIQLDSQTQAALGAFEGAIKPLPWVQQCWRLSGDADFLLKCVSTGVEGMSRQLRQFAALPGVRTIRSFPSLGQSKDGLLPIPDDGAPE